jgi:hypothetical protein
MSTQARSIGRAVGVLYILGTVCGVLSATVTSGLSGSNDPLAAAASRQDELAIGAILILTMAAALAMIPVVAYPILSQVSTLLARGYFLFRSVLEAVTYVMTVVGWLLLASVSASPDVPAVWGETLFDLEGAAVAGPIYFLTGAGMFYVILYRGRLPRWLSTWGLVAILPSLVSVFLVLFTDVDVSTNSTMTVLLDLPIGLQEVVLAVWLIVKGFATDQVELAQRSVPTVGPG